MTLEKFWQAFVRLPGADGALGCPTPHREQRRFLEAADARDPATGRTRYGTLFLDWGKKSAKSFSAGVFALGRLVADPWCPPGLPRVIGLAAWDFEQTLTVYRQIEQLVKAHPWLLKRVRLLAGEAVFSETRRDPRTGGTYALDHRILRLARDSRGTHGLGFTAIVRDELHTDPNADMSESLIVTPSAPSGQTLVLSYHAPLSLARRGVPLHDLRTRVAANDGTVFHSYIGGTGEAAPWRVVPWITHAWVEQQRLALAAAPSRFTRIILNEPAGESGGLIAAHELRAALVDGPEPEAGARGVRYYGALDLGATCDETAFVVGHVDSDGRLVVDLVRRWTGTVDAPVSFLGVQAELERVARRFPLTRLDCDQWQSRQLVEALQRQRIPARLVTLGASQLDEGVTALKAAFARRLIAVPSREGEMLEQLESLSTVETTRGRRDLLKFQPTGESGVTAHDDLAVALAMLVVMAGKAGLGSLRLPADFTTCFRRDAGLAPNCFLIGDSLGYPADPICRECPGLQFVKAAHGRHLAAGAEPVDVRTFYTRSVRGNDLTTERAFRAWVDLYL